MRVYNAEAVGTAIITSGSIDNTPIGASTASTGAFTTLKATNAITQKAYTANSSTAYTIDAVNGGQLDLTLNGVTPVITLQTVVAGQSYSLPVNLIQDGTGGRVPSWANVTWAAGVAP